MSFNKKVLEINPSHPLIKVLLDKVNEAKSSDPEASLPDEQADLLYLVT